MKKHYDYVSPMKAQLAQPGDRFQGATVYPAGANNRGHSLKVAMEEYTHSTVGQKSEAVRKLEDLSTERHIGPR